MSEEIPAINTENTTEINDVDEDVQTSLLDMLAQASLNRRPKVGTRVFAMMSSDDTTIKLFGMGTYTHDFVEDITFEQVQQDPRFELPDGMTLEEARASWENYKKSALYRARSSDPVIKLDNGKEVRGSQCWWGPEERFNEEFINNRQVINVDIDEELAKAKAEHEAQEKANAVSQDQGQGTDKDGTGSDGPAFTD